MKKIENYILFIYDFFSGNREHLPHVIPLRLLPLTEGDIKFVYGDYGMICNLESRKSFKKIKKLVKKSLKGEVDQYFLIKVPEDMVVYMPGNMVDGLFGKYHNVETVHWKPKKEHMDEMFNKIMDDLYDEGSNDFGRPPKPSLDQILDKISRSGFDSLSDLEKDLLKKYSKN